MTQSDITTRTTRHFVDQAARCFAMAAEATNETVATALRDMGARLLELAQSDEEPTDTIHPAPAKVALRG